MQDRCDYVHEACLVSWTSKASHYWPVQMSQGQAKAPHPARTVFLSLEAVKLIVLPMTFQFNLATYADHAGGLFGYLSSLLDPSVC